MRNMIAKVGRPGIVTIITLLSIIATVLFVFTALKLFDREFDSLLLSISILAPAIIAPSVTWYMVGLLIKIHQLEIEMRSLANIDMLTKVMTRRAFLSNCETLYQVVRRNKSSLSLVYIDLDDFKKINDSYGHAGGDAVLQSFALILKKCVRKSDLVGRIGGEEFALMLPDTELEGALQLVNKIQLLVKNTGVKFSDQNIQYTVSIGIAIYDQDKPIELEELIRRSDKALYRAKHAGKNCVENLGLE